MNKTKTVLIVSIIVMFLIIVGSFSYAYLQTSAIQQGQNQIQLLNCLNVSITNMSGSSPISLTNAFPIPDYEGLQSTPYNFTVTNSCTTSVSVDINLESLNVQNALDKSHVKVALDSVSVLRPIGYILDDQPERDATIVDATSNNLTNIILTSNESKNYSLRLWVDENTTTAQGMGTIYQGKIAAVATPTLKYKPNTNLKNAQSGTLLAYLRDGNYNYKAPLTAPGREVSTASEDIISSTPDDYGTSYYFRGAVDNNFVVFAGMCWRIVRVTGNGAIKLVIVNKDGTSCSVSSNQFLGNSSINSSTGKNAYIGYMYGSPGSNSYAAEHANINNSNLLNIVSSWYNTAFSSSQQDLIADVIWCNDKSISGSGLGYNANATNYGAYGRLVTPVTAAPSLICPNDANGGKLSKYTAQENQIGNAALHNAAGTEFYKIGLVTADEAAFAGGVYGVANSTYYLVKGTYYFKLLSPWSLNYQSTHIASNGSLGTGNAAYAVRPSIALIPDVEVYLNGVGEPGTSSNPYIVDEGTS